VDPYGNRFVGSAGPSVNGAQGKVDVFDASGAFVTTVAVETPDKEMYLAVDSQGVLYVSRQASELQNPVDNTERLVRFTPTSGSDPSTGELAYDPDPTVMPNPYPISGFPSGTWLATPALAVDPTDDHHFLSGVKEGAVVGGVGQPDQPGLIEFTSAAEGNALVGVVQLPGTTEGIRFMQSLALDGDGGRIFVSDLDHAPALPGAKAVVKVFDANTPADHSLPRQLLFTIDGSTTPTNRFVSEPRSLTLAVDESTGHVFVGDMEAPTRRVYEFDENGDPVSTIEGKFAPTGAVRLQMAYDDGPTSPTAGYLFVPSGNGPGHSLAFGPKPQIAAPAVDSLSVSSVTTDEAILHAKVNPGALHTTYRFEYTTEGDFQSQGFAGATVGGEGVLEPSNEGLAVSAAISGLAPGLDYRFRVFAENELGEDEGQAAFRTYAAPEIDDQCPNQPLRAGLSALLPDCRAYELVTPANTNGHAPFVSGVGPLFSSRLASPSGDALSFQAEGGVLPGLEGTGALNDPYLSIRGEQGWVTEGSGSTGDFVRAVSAGSPSADQRYLVWESNGSGIGLIDGFKTTYLRYPDGHSEPVGRGSLATQPNVTVGLISADGSHLIFGTGSTGGSSAGPFDLQLEPSAPPDGTRAVYDRAPDGTLRVVSLLPGDITPAPGQSANFIGASLDGEGVAFKIADTLYLRYRNAATYEIGTGLAFDGVSSDGSRLFYLQAGDLYAFDAETGSRIAFTDSGDITPVNIGSDGTAAYFVSPSVLPDSGSPAQNPQGDSPVLPAKGSGVLGAKGTGTLSAAKGTGTLSAASTEVTALSTVEGAFEVGMQVSGTGIPPKTTIAAVAPGALTLSQPATQAGTTSLTAGSPTVTSVSTSEGAFEVGMPISGPGIPANTTIAAVDTGSLTLSQIANQAGLSALAAESKKVHAAVAAQGTFEVGRTITGTGIPAGTTITAVDSSAHTLTLSKAAKASGSQQIVAGAQNLYLSREGEVSFVGTLSDRDVTGVLSGILNEIRGLGLWGKAAEASAQPGRFAADPSRATADGGTLLFESNAKLTTYDPEGQTQVYRYDLGEHSLSCLSCLPTGGASSGEATLESLDTGFGYINAHSLINNLSADGSRAFFESTEPLVVSDTDGLRDVYQWERQGAGGCTHAGGCLDLISSGQSGRDDYLWAASDSGADVFIWTADLLLPAEDPDETPSIYDARIGGGFASPKGASGECLGEACQPNVVPPDDPSPASSSYRGPGNPTEEKPNGRRPCPKGKRAVRRHGKRRCVTRKHRGHRKHHSRAKGNRRAGR
jgi:hypothetical protein